MRSRFYVGSYGRSDQVGVSRYEADFKNKKFICELATIGLEWPSFVLRHPNGRVLYAVRELTAEGAVHALKIEDGDLVPYCTMPTGGADPCNMCLDDRGSFLFVANYSGSTVAVFRLDDEGIPLERTDCKRHHGSGPVTARQSDAHPHCVLYRDGILFVCDLGTDTIYRYRLNRESGVLEADWCISAPAGAGPRHLCFHPEHPELMYVICELSSQICLFRLTEQGAQMMQTVSTLPEDFSGENIAAAIKFSDDGKTLFASNRGHNSIAVFSVGADGSLSMEQTFPCGGLTPRDFTPFGEYILVANQDSNTITTLKYDADSRRLSDYGMELDITAPTHILRLEA